MKLTEPKRDATPACAEADIPLEEWVPEDGSPKRVPPKIKALCAGCPVNAECFEFAILHDVEGYWAGTSKHGRRKYRRENGIIIEGVTEWIDRELRLPSAMSRSMTRQYASGVRQRDAYTKNLGR